MCNFRVSVYCSSAATLWASLCLGLLVGCSDPPQKENVSSKSPEVDPHEIFDQMCAFYRQAKTYTDRSKVVEYSVPRNSGSEVELPYQYLSVAFARENKLRVSYSTIETDAENRVEYVIACNGEIVRSSASEAPGQIHEAVAPQTLTKENFAPEPLLREDLLQFSIENILPQLALLLTEEGNNQDVFPQDKLDHLLKDAELDGKMYHRIQMTSPAGKRVLWIDKENYSLRRMELPIDAQPDFANIKNQYLEFKICIDFEQHSFDSYLDDTIFDMELPTGARRVRRFIAPPPPAPQDGDKQALEKHELLVQQFDLALEAATIKTDIIDIELNLPDVAEEKLPSEIQLREMWQTNSEQLSRPDHFLVFQSGSEEEANLLVLDKGREIVEIDLAGQVLGRHALPEHKEPHTGFLRYALDEKDKPWFLVSGTGWQKVYLWNEAWENVLTFPEGKHSGIGDVYLDDLTGNRPPRMHVGYQGGLGIHAGALDGRRLWTNRFLDYVIGIYPGPQDAKGNTSLWCTSTRGTILQMSPAGQTTLELAVLGKALMYVAYNPDADSHAGLAIKDVGQYSAVGFSSEGEVLWEYELPVGEYSRNVQKIQYVELPEFGNCWLIAAADGSLHVLDTNGKFIDRFANGELLTGVALAEIEEDSILFLSTPTRLTAWEISTSSE